MDPSGLSMGMHSEEPASAAAWSLRRRQLLNQAAPVKPPPMKQSTLGPLALDKDVVQPPPLKTVPVWQLERSRICTEPELKAAQTFGPMPPNVKPAPSQAVELSKTWMSTARVGVAIASIVAMASKRRDKDFVVVILRG